MPIILFLPKHPQQQPTAEEIKSAKIFCENILQLTAQLHTNLTGSQSIIYLLHSQQLLDNILSIDDPAYLPQAIQEVLEILEISYIAYATQGKQKEFKQIVEGWMIQHAEFYDQIKGDAKE